MSKMITSAGGDYSTMLPQSVYGDGEMKMMEEESVSTVDNSMLMARHMSAANFASSPMARNNSAARVPSKGKGGKKLRTDEDDEEIDLDKCIAEDHNRISVKILRKVIPKLRIACYYSDEQVSGKKKLKHLWDEKPADWPDSIPFKDPNNAIKDAKKPGKDELAPMYEYLRERYLEKKSTGEIPVSYAGAQQIQDVPSVGGSGSYQDGMYIAMVPSIGHLSQSEDDGHNATYSAVTTTEESKFWNQPMAWAASHEQSRSSMIFSIDDNRSAAVLAPTATTRAEHQSLVMNRQILPNLTAMPEQIATNWLAQTANEQVSRSSFRGPPAPVRDLYHRLKDKQNQVDTISGHNGGVQVLLAAVQKEVIDCMYDKLQPDDTKLCLMFLDMGHQYEALLDVMLVLDKMEEGEQKLLHSGCQEIIQKFNKECSTLMALFGITQSRDADTGMINSTVKSAVYGLPESLLQGLVNGDKLTSVCLPDDDKLKAVEGVPDASTLGIRQRLSLNPEVQLQLDLTKLSHIHVSNQIPVSFDDDGGKKIYSDMDEMCREFFPDEYEQQQQQIPQPQLTDMSQIQLVETGPAVDCSRPLSACSYIGHQSGLTSEHNSVASFGASGGVLIGADVALAYSGGNGSLDFEEMDTDALLNDIVDTINSETTGDADLCSGGAANQWVYSSMPIMASSNNGDYNSLPSSWPNNTNSGVRVLPEPLRQQSASGLGQTGLRPINITHMPTARPSAIPVSVENASVDDMDDDDRRSHSRRRQSRGSVNSRNGRQYNGRT